MFAIARFMVPLGDAANFEIQLDDALAAFSGCTGYVSGEIGQNLDDPTLWSLVTHWANVGKFVGSSSNLRIKMPKAKVSGL
jgi:heme-degrading monooxygenase HmoA